jgi:hypothetical protein
MDLLIAEMAVQDGLAKLGIPVSPARHIVRSFVDITPIEIRTGLGVSEKTLQRGADATLEADASDRVLRLLAPRCFVWKPTPTVSAGQEPHLVLVDGEAAFLSRRWA